MSGSCVTSVNSAHLSVIAVDWSVLAENLSLIVSSACFECFTRFCWAGASLWLARLWVEGRALASKSVSTLHALGSVARSVWLAVEEVTERSWWTFLVSSWCVSITISGYLVVDEGETLQFGRLCNSQSITASLVLAGASRNEFVVTSSSLWIARVLSALDSIVASW